MHVCRKMVVPVHRKILVIWRNYKRFNTILNSKILLNLMRKIEYLIDQYFNCVFVFVLATPNSYIYFCTATQLASRAYARGEEGFGLKPPLEFAMLQKRHYLCKGVCVCFRTFFACLMST